MDIYNGIKAATERGHRWTDKRHELEDKYPIFLTCEALIVIDGPIIGLAIYLLHKAFLV